MSPIQTSAPSQAPDMSGALFGHSADGILVALVGDNAYAMMPGRHGKHYLASGWRIARPMTEWTRSDFYGHGGDLADETAFRSKVLEQAQHFEERRRLGRSDIPGGAHTPWGPSQGGTVYAEGVTSLATAGHGGFKLSADRNRKVHPMLRAAGGWYEGDECWAIVAFTFPHLFTALERRYAERTIKDSWPDAWEAIFGTILEPGESRRKDQRAFEMAHANDWIVVSAITSERQKASSSASRRPVANAAPTSRSAGSSSRSTNTKSAGSASSSIRIAIPSMPVHPTSWAGGRGGRHDPRAGVPPATHPHGGGVSANAASAGHGGPADHAAYDGADP